MLSHDITDFHVFHRQSSLRYPATITQDRQAIEIFPHGLYSELSYIQAFHIWK